MGMDLPDTITLRSILGIFRMESHDGEYRGRSNGFSLTIRPSDGGYTAEAVSDRDGWGAAAKTVEIPFTDADSLTASMEIWLDGLCPQVVEEYADDVRYLETVRGKVAYYSYNTDLDTVPVVFVHGGPGGECNPVKARRLKLAHPVYAYDQMGCGRSDPIKDLDGWGLDDYVAELSEFIDHIGSDKVILIGASWGAGLSVAYAESTGCSKIAAMVLPSPFVSSRRWADDQMKNLKAMSDGMYEGMRRCIRDNDLGPEFKRIMGEYYARYLFCRECFRDIAIANAEEPFSDVFLTLWGPNDMVCTGTLKDFDVVPGMKDISVPTLFMCGDSDEVTVETMLEYRGLVKGSRFAVIPYAGHVTAMEQFDLYRESIVAFLRENGFDM